MHPVASSANTSIASSGVRVLSPEGAEFGIDNMIAGHACA